MFTGIIDHCGQIKAIKKADDYFQLTIASQFSDLSIGESIAIDGACLTVTSYSDGLFTVDLSKETVRLTTAAFYEPLMTVNLERALTLTDRLGGHFVTGHVDGMGRVSHIKELAEFKEYVFDEISPDFRYYLVKKGSIAVNGVSLTINEVEKNYFTVMLIPHTLERTNLSQLLVGDKINLEFDYLAKLVRNQLSEKI